MVRRLLLSIVVGVTLLFCTSPVVRGDVDHDARSVREYSYGSQPRQRLFAYRAVRDSGAGGRSPCVVIVHGGFWIQDQSRGWNKWARRIAASGITVFDIDYRRNVDARWPAQRSDVLRALRWIRTRADVFDVDPRRTVLLGSSAGGQVAAAVGTYGAGGRHLAGVVALSPVSDPYRAWRAGADHRPDGMWVLRTNAARLAGCAPDRGSAGERARCRRSWWDMAPAGRASGSDDAPMLLVHSRRDFVPVEHSEELRAAEVRRGMAPGDITVMTVPGDKHGGTLMRMPHVASRVLAWIVERTGAARG